METLIPQEVIEERIFVLRGQRIMIDRDLAQLFEVETKYLNRQVKRNLIRFPSEFMFQLNEEERNQLVTNWHRFESLKHTANLPYAFTENGVAMLSTVLKSERAVKLSIFIIKTFIRLREILTTNKDLAYKIGELESKYDIQFQVVFQAINDLIKKDNKPRKEVGYLAKP